MSIITRMLREKAVYWAPGQGDFDNFGKPITEEPVLISCRWEEIAEMFLDEEGNEVLSNARVYVDRDVESRGYLKRLGQTGLLSNLDSTVWDQNNGVFIVRKFNSLPKLGYSEFLRWVML